MKRLLSLLTSLRSLLLWRPVVAMRANIPKMQTTNTVRKKEVRTPNIMTMAKKLQARFAEGKGLMLLDETKEAIGLALAEAEGELAPTISWKRRFSKCR